MTDQKENMLPRSALATLADVRAGQFVEDLTIALADLTQSVIVQQKSGKLTLVLKVSPGPGSDNAVLIADEIKLAAPRASTKPTLMFSDEEGSLTRKDPRQGELKLEESGKVQRIRKG